MTRDSFCGLRGRDPAQRFAQLPTPCYILDEARLRENAELLGALARRTGAKMLLAQRAFSNFDLYGVLAPHLAGTEASGLYEARLGRETLPDKEVHTFAAAFSPQELPEVLRWSDHIVFNSPRQLARYGAAAKAAGCSVGLRVNPGLSTQGEHALYDPCAPGSRLGTTRAQWEREMTPALTGLLDGLHFHTLCEQDADDLDRTLAAVEAQFADVLPQLKWLNFGGGHHITRPGYNLPLLEQCIARVRARGLAVYLEPGEAWALDAGYLACRVLDLPVNGAVHLALVDTSAACHMPDVLEMPYRPPLFGAGEPGQKAHTYRLGGPTCLAGDIIGDYSFDQPLAEGQLLLFGDMAIYTTCKNNTFNGLPLPAIYVLREGGECELLRTFAYRDFKMRLGRME